MSYSQKFKKYCEQEKFLTFTPKALVFSEIKKSENATVLCWIKFDPELHDDCVVDYMFENSGFDKTIEMSDFTSVMMKIMLDREVLTRKFIQLMGARKGEAFKFAFLKPSNGAGKKLIFVIFYEPNFLEEAPCGEKVLKLKH